MSTIYRVFITPKLGLFTYGDEIEVSDYIDAKGISSIKLSVDSTDYDMGSFKYADVTLKAINRNGHFNDPSDKRSLFFPYSRDLAKVKIEFENSDGDTILFKGLINEEATKADFKNDSISFRVLSLDSVIRKTQVSAGAIASGMLCSLAIKTVLDIPAITSVLNFDPMNISVDHDFVIDDGSAFDSVSTRDAINLLLVSSNSVMTIDPSDTIIVRNRNGNSKSILSIYGPYDLKMRQNAIDLKDFNSGKQRMFNSFLVNLTRAENTAYIQQYGFRQKFLELPFITSGETESAIASRLLDEFKLPKIEMVIDVPTYLVRDSTLYDPVSVDWSLRITPIAGKFLPIVGDTKIGDSDMPLPNEYGSLSIDPGVAFKIIELNHNPGTFVTSLKLRQMGKDFADGYFRTPESSIIGFGVIGAAIIGSGSEDPPIGNFISLAVIGSEVIG